MRTLSPINIQLVSVHLPLLQAHQVIPLSTLRKARNLEPASLAVIAGSVRSTDRVLNDILSSGGSLNLGIGSQAAGDSHAGNGVRGGGAEGAGGGVCQAQGRAERSEGGHFDFGVE